MPASPCALGGALDNELAEALRARIVCGSAENQMASVSAGQALHDRGVLYTPDRIVNAGGLIQAVGKMSGYSYERAKDKTCKIFDATPLSSRSRRNRSFRRPRQLRRSLRSVSLRHRTAGSGCRSEAGRRARPARGRTGLRIARRRWPRRQLADSVSSALSPPSTAVRSRNVRVLP
jgi:hypothetical protein